jgi:hypothetical protein
MIGFLSAIACQVQLRPTAWQQRGDSGAKNTSRGAGQVGKNYMRRVTGSVYGIFEPTASSTVPQDDAERVPSKSSA